MQGMPESGTAMSQGRATGKVDTESTEGKNKHNAGGKGILAQSGTAKSATTTGIKRVPSRSKFSDKQVSIIS